MSEEKPTLKAEDLSQFTGTENVFRVAPGVVITEGVKYVADRAGSFWLASEIALAQRFDSAVAGEAFQLWKLDVKADRTAILTCEDGNDRVVYKKAIPFTDFPLAEIKFYYCNGTIMLPSEY